MWPPVSLSVLGKLGVREKKKRKKKGERSPGGDRTFVIKFPNVARNTSLFTARWRKASETAKVMRTKQHPMKLRAEQARSMAMTLRASSGERPRMVAVARDRGA
jgi:hypothetical protein